MKPWEEDDTFLARWLSGELSEEEKRNFEASEESKEFSDLVMASKALEIPKYDVEKALKDVKSRQQQQQKTKVFSLKTWTPILAAASVVLLVALFFLWPRNMEYNSSYGEQLVVLLPDSSEVILNANSYVKYNAKSWQDNREIELKGEGFFKVKKGSTFSVKTDKGSVTVLGTSFTVKNWKDILDVHCFTGKVQVKQGDFSDILTKGEALRAKNERLIFKKRHSENSPSWMEGITKLEDVSIPQVLNELENQFGLKTDYEQLPNKRFTGSFPNNNAEQAIRLVLEPLGISYDYDASKKLLKLK